jgi:uncharacterized coiled-coil protein SlyX
MSTKDEPNEAIRHRAVKLGSFAKAVFEGDEPAPSPMLTSDKERTIRNLRQFELIRDRQAAQTVASPANGARRTPGPRGVTDKEVSAAADRIWQQGKGTVPTVKAVQAELGTGSTVKVGSLLIEWSIRNGLTSPPPPIPMPLAKSLNDYIDDIRKKTAKEWSDVLDASRQDNFALLDALREAESRIEELTSSVAEARARCDELNGAMKQQDAEILRAHCYLNSLHERLIPITSKAECLEYERDSLLEKLNEMQTVLDTIRRKVDTLSTELVRAQIDEAKAKGELEGLMLKLAEANRVEARNSAQGEKS